MNATTFFPEAMFHQLKQDVSEKKVYGWMDTPYQKKIKVKGNTYDLSITTGYYIVNDHAYFVHFGEDHHYPGNIGGSGGSQIPLDSYETFCDFINKRLKKFPDYTEPVFEPVQLSLFW